MRFQISTSLGFAKLGKFKNDTQIIETPTIIKLIHGNSPYFELGDGKDKIRISSVPDYFNSLNNTDFEIIFFDNLFMVQTLEEKLVIKSLEKNFQNVREKLKVFPKEKIAIAIQPNTSIKVLEYILQEIISLQIKNIAIINLLSIINNQRQLVDFLAKLRSQLPIDSLFFILSPVPHTHLPILAYLGVDIFSDEYAIIAAKQNLYLTENSGYLIEEIKENICSCSICSQYDEVVDLQKIFRSAEGKKLLTIHNQFIFQKKIREIRFALKNNDLRSHIEQSISSHVLSAAALKIFDNDWMELLIKRTPTWSDIPVRTITSYSFSRPEILEYQKRVRERFQIPENKKLVVIFPCSAKKPYSESKSHQMFQQALLPENGKISLIQELILTSPIGIVPRQLERIFPAAHYDIPVSGDWNTEEKEVAIDQLVNVLSKIEKDVPVIAHVSNEYVELCKQAEQKLNRKFIYTSIGEKSTSSKSLSNLSKNVIQLLEGSNPIKEDATEKVRAIADFQFGPPLGEELFPNKVVLKGKVPMPFKILQNNKQLGVIHPSSGKLTISMENADILARKKKYYVTFEGEKLEGSTLFAVGIIDADEDIRPSDEVVIVDKNFNLLGVGQALLSGYDMKLLSSGSAVKIRQKK
ncbi:MAG: tRNA-guanine transglycosylase [Candidatus Thorarchaeota archaeon]